MIDVRRLGAPLGRLAAEGVDSSAGGMTRRDWMLWAVLTALMVLENSAVSPGGVDWPWVVAMAVVFGVAIRFRRTRPLIAFVAVAAVTFGELAKATVGDRGVSTVYLVVLVVVCYCVGRHSGAVRGFVVLVLAGDLALGVPTVVLRASPPVADAILSWLWLVIGSLVFVILPWLYGRYREQSARLVSAGWERAERMESEQQLAVEQARLRERNRIAQDMHDSLGHELSLIAVRAAALEVDRDLSERYRRAAGELRVSAATATERLGEVIGVLRADESPAPTVPTNETVADVVDRAAASGVLVELRTEGERVDLPGAVQQAAARVVQEALTNVAKHAPGAQVGVTMRYGEDGLCLEVRNGAPGSAELTSVAASSGGHGLAGLDERVRLLGGELSAGRAGEGFTVAAILPYGIEIPGIREPAAPDRSETATEHEDVRRRTRRRLVNTVVAPAVVGVAIGAVMLIYYFVIGYASVLDPADYDKLRVGQSRPEIEGLLPPVEMIDAPDAEDSTRGNCVFYRSAEPLSGTFVYRLCFADDELISKDAIQSGSTPIE